LDRDRQDPLCLLSCLLRCAVLCCAALWYVRQRQREQPPFRLAHDSTSIISVVADCPRGCGLFLGFDGTGRDDSRHDVTVSLSLSLSRWQGDASRSARWFASCELVGRCVQEPVLFCFVLFCSVLFHSTE